MSHRDHDTPVGKAQNDPRRSPRKRSPKKDWTYMPSTSLTPEPRYLILKTALLFNEIPTSHYHPLLNIYTWTSRADFRSCDSDAPILPSPTYNLNAADIRSQSKTLPSRESVSRSASPVKKFVDLYFTEVPTEYEDLDGHVAAKLGILTMYRRLQEIEEGVGIIPISLKVLMEKNYHEADRPPSRAYTSSYFQSPNIATEDYARKMGDKAMEIRNAAQRCDKTRGEEYDWSYEVQIPLLKLIMSHPKYSGAVDYAIIKTARISPRELLSKHSSGATMQSKKVDFAIILEPSDVLAGKIHNVLKPLPMQLRSINQSDMSSIIKRPIAFSMVAKPPFCGDEDADIQLSIWVGAGIKRLRWMMKETSRGTPVFPALSMNGHDLFLVVFEDQGTKNVMYGKMHLGRTHTITGVFQIIAAMDILVEWANTDYREWFESIIS